MDRERRPTSPGGGTPLFTRAAHAHVFTRAAHAHALLEPMTGRATVTATSCRSARHFVVEVWHVDCSRFLKSQTKT